MKLGSLLARSLVALAVTLPLAWGCGGGGEVATGEAEEPNTGPGMPATIKPPGFDKGAAAKTSPASGKSSDSAGKGESKK